MAARYVVGRGLLDATIRNCVLSYGWAEEDAEAILLLGLATTDYLLLTSGYWSYLLLTTDYSL